MGKTQNWRGSSLPTGAPHILAAPLLSPISLSSLCPPSLSLSSTPWLFLLFCPPPLGCASPSFQPHLSPLPPFPDSPSPCPPSSAPCSLSPVARHRLHLLTWQASFPMLPPAHNMLSVILPGYAARQVALETMAMLRHCSLSGNGPGGGRWMLPIPPEAPTSLLSRKLGPKLCPVPSLLPPL